MTELTLGRGVALEGGLLIPVEGFSEIGHDVDAVLERIPQLALGDGILIVFRPLMKCGEGCWKTYGGVWGQGGRKAQ
jgi:hypothetical protein